MKILQKLNGKKTLTAGSLAPITAGIVIASQFVELGENKEDMAAAIVAGINGLIGLIGVFHKIVKAIASKKAA